MPERAARRGVPLENAAQLGREVHQALRRRADVVVLFLGDRAHQPLQLRDQHAQVQDRCRVVQQPPLDAVQLARRPERVLAAEQGGLLEQDRLLVLQWTSMTSISPQSVSKRKQRVPLHALVEDEVVHPDNPERGPTRGGCMGSAAWRSRHNAMQRAARRLLAEVSDGPPRYGSCRCTWHSTTCRRSGCTRRASNPGAGASRTRSGTASRAGREPASPTRPRLPPSAAQSPGPRRRRATHPRC
jgi:hypothetical protein